MECSKQTSHLLFADPSKRDQHLELELYSNDLQTSNLLFAEPSETDQDLELELYFKYLQAQANGFDGTWESFVDEEFTDPNREAAILENLMVEGDEMVGTAGHFVDALLVKLPAASKKLFYYYVVCFLVGKLTTPVGEAVVLGQLILEEDEW